MITARYVGGLIVRVGLPGTPPGPLPSGPLAGLYPSDTLWPSLDLYPIDGPGLGPGE